MSGCGYNQKFYIYRAVIPAIPPKADVGGASVRFPRLRRLYPQVRAVGVGAPFACI